VPGPSSSPLELARPELAPIIDIGSPTVLTGAYLLHLWLPTPASVTLGRFQRGMPVQLPVGSLLYAGSAMGAAARAPLAHRLLRHARRSSGKPSHPLLSILHNHFKISSDWQADLAQTAARSAKRLHWHIDYLVDLTEVELLQVIIVRSELPCEQIVAQHLAQDPLVRILQPGIGATDLPGATHLFVAPAEPVWWDKLPHQLAQRLW
jgi:Uri superfamily endonuclease